MIRISVKGSREDSEKELRARRIEATHTKTLIGASFFDVEEKYRLQLVAWYCERSVADCSAVTGYPVGTLLYHN